MQAKKIKRLAGWYNANRVLSYNAIINFILGGRNIGKTWGLKKRAYRRAVKKHKKCIWVRRTKEEAAECARTFFTSSDLRKFCGIPQLVTNTKKEKEPEENSIRQNGRTIYIYKNKKWEWFINIIALCEYKKMRSSDDIDCDTIVFDEFTATPEKYILYRGNEAQDFIDLFISIKRQHKVTCILSGNKESVSNPILNYFNIPPIPLTFQGIRTFKRGTIVVQQVNDLPPLESEFDRKVDILLSGTQYGNYLNKATYKNQPTIKISRTPAGSEGYIQLYWRGQHINIRRAVNSGTYEPELYVGGENDTTVTIFTDTTQRKFRSQITLIKKEHRQYFRLLEQCVSDNRVAYESYKDYENILTFYGWLGIKN